MLKNIKAQFKVSLIANASSLCLLATFLTFNPLNVIAENTTEKPKSGSTSTSTSTSGSKANENNVYPAAFFEQYRPQNALEMIERLPGFNYDQGSNQRGFGGNAGNVLIDGKRPTSKSGGLKSTLVRITAAQVDRIEIIRGGISAGEASGQSVVANIIRKNEGTSGRWAAKLRRAPDGTTLPNIEAAISTQIADWKTAFDLDIGGGPGYRTSLVEERNAEDVLTSVSDESLKDSARWIFVSAEGATGFAKGELILNSRLGGSKFKADTNREIYNDRFPDDAPFESFWDLNEENNFKMAELSADWTRVNGDWKWHAIGLGLVNDVNYKNRFHFEDSLSGNVNDSNFAKDSVKSEFITRVTYANVGKNLLKPEFGIEVARNKLTNESEFFRDGTQVQLNGSNVVVKELRTELFASFIYSLNDQLSIEGGLTGEFSNIKVFNPSGLLREQDFKFIKPRLSATYRLDKKRQLTFEASRKVGQLNFNDFAASTQTSDDRVTAGNPNLSPDTKDILAVSYDWSFSQKGSFRVRAYHEWRSDILEQIILSEEGAERQQTGLGNAGDAKFWGIKTDINLPIDSILKNGLMVFSHQYNNSSFDDPIINGERTINGYTHNWLKINLRQDIIDQQWAWGVEYWGDFEDRNYFVDEITTFGANKRYLIFIETSRFFGVKTQLEIKHANTGDYTRSRFLYNGNRGNEYVGSQISRRQRRPEIKLSFFGTF